MPAGRIDSDLKVAGSLYPKLAIQVQLNSWENGMVTSSVGKRVLHGSKIIALQWINSI